MEWLDQLIWKGRELLAIAETSPWFPVLVVVSISLSLLWLTGRLRKSQLNVELNSAEPIKRSQLSRFRRKDVSPVTRKGKNGATCKWYKDSIRRDGTLERWQCRTCGVDAFTSDGAPPKECKRDLRETQL
jgi:hypothetical protein